MYITAAAAMFCSQFVSADARVTVAHFAPFAENIDDTSVSIALNGVVALENVKFKDFTDYIALPAGEYVVDVMPTGTMDVAMTATFMLEDGMDYTVFASGNGTLQPLELLALVDDDTAPAMGNVKVRVVHAAPFAPTLEGTEVSIRTAKGALVAGLQGVAYGVSSGYLELPADTYDLKVASNNGQVNYIDPLPVELPEGTIATLFAVGDIITQDLSIIATPIAELPLRDPVDDSINGAFMLDGYDGEGFFLIPIPAKNRLVGSWNTYADDHAGTPIWYTFDSKSGGFDGMIATAILYQSTGPTSEGGMQTNVAVGTIDFYVVNCSLVEATVAVGSNLKMYDGVRITPSASCAP